MTWDEVLDGYESALDDAERVLAVRGDLGSGGGWVPPAGLGPLPPALRPRAEALLARTAALELVAVHAVDETADEIRGLPRRREVRPGREPELLDRHL